MKMLLSENGVDYQEHVEKDGCEFRIPGSQKKVEGGDWISFMFDAHGKLVRISTIEYWKGVERV